ncbi:hypothetical protein C8Q77DRAFT_1072109 [Trametes polyzona]|nr:hypothetical protein C8Q77DRAFT_1072109 [Trametes polyzona]
MATTWAVLSKARASDSYSYIDHYNGPRLDATDTLQCVVDRILSTPSVSGSIQDHDPESWSYKIYELPELPITGPASVKHRRAAYEGSITDAYLDECILYDPDDAIGEVKNPRNLVMVIYELASRPQHSNLSRPLSPAPEHYDQQTLRNKIASVGKALGPPSSEATVDRLCVTQTSTFPAAVHNGRPLDLTGLPPSIYHPAFAAFLRLMHDDQHEFTRADILTARSCVDACVAFYRDEDQRIKDLKHTGLERAVHPLQRTFLTSFPHLLSSGRIAPDGSLSAPAENSNDSALFCIVEVENEIGKGTCDPIAQAEQCYKAFFCSDEARPYYQVSCCPCLLVTIAGPNIMVSGAVVGDHIISQPLTDYITLIPRFTSDGLSPHSAAVRRMARLIRALRETLAELEDFYTSLKLAPSKPLQEPPTNGGRSRGSELRSQNRRDAMSVQAQAYIGPHFTAFTDTDGARVELQYTGRLSPDESRMAVFTAAAYTSPTAAAGAAQPEPKEVVVKFAHTYSAAAHGLLADHALAPKLWFCEKVPSVGMYVIVMDHLKGMQDAADRTMTPAEHAALGKAVKLLHDEDLAFGDLRGPNVLLSDLGPVLIDFEWCGREGVVCYPEDINMEDAIGWHPDVFPGEKIKKEHDRHMLDVLGSGTKEQSY